MKVKAWGAFPRRPSFTPGISWSSINVTLFMAVPASSSYRRIASAATSVLLHLFVPQSKTGLWLRSRLIQILLFWRPGCLPSPQPTVGQKTLIQLCRFHHRRISTPRLHTLSTRRQLLKDRISAAKGVRPHHQATLLSTSTVAFHVAGTPLVWSMTLHRLFISWTVAGRLVLMINFTDLISTHILRLLHQFQAVLKRWRSAPVALSPRPWRKHFPFYVSLSPLHACFIMKINGFPGTVSSKTCIGGVQSFRTQERKSCIWKQLMLCSPHIMSPRTIIHTKNAYALHGWHPHHQDHERWFTSLPAVPSWSTSSQQSFNHLFLWGRGLLCLSV